MIRQATPLFAYLAMFVASAYLGWLPYATAQTTRPQLEEAAKPLSTVQIEARRKEAVTKATEALKAARIALNSVKTPAERQRLTSHIQEKSETLAALRRIPTSDLGRALADLDEKNRQIDDNATKEIGSPEKFVLYSVNKAIAEDKLQAVAPAAKVISCTVTGSRVQTKDLGGVPRPVIPHMTDVYLDFTLEAKTDKLRFNKSASLTVITFGKNVYGILAQSVRYDGELKNGDALRAGMQVTFPEFQHIELSLRDVSSKTAATASAPASR